MHFKKKKGGVLYYFIRVVDFRQDQKVYEEGPKKSASDDIVVSCLGNKGKDHAYAM